MKPTGISEFVTFASILPITFTGNLPAVLKHKKFFPRNLLSNRLEKVQSLPGCVQYQRL